MATIEDIPFDVLTEIIKYLDFRTLQTFRLIVYTNRVMKEVFYTWITQEMEKRAVLKVTESKINNLASPIMLIGNSNYDIAIDIPIETFARNMVQQVVTEHRSRIKEVNLYEDSPHYLVHILPNLTAVEKLRVIGLHYSEVTTVLLQAVLFQNIHLTTIELTFVKFPREVIFSREKLPNVINLKLTECQGAGAASLLAAVDLTLQKLELTDCYSRFMIPRGVQMPKIRELSIKTKHRVMSLDLNLTKVGASLEKLVVKGGVVFSPGVRLNRLPKVKTLILDSCNIGYAREVLEACADSVTTIEFVGMNIGRVCKSFPNLQYVILNYCEGDLGELLQRGIKISTLHVREFTHRNTLERMVYNLKILSINGKQVQIGKAPILSGRKESKEIEVRSHFDRRDVRSHFDHSAT